MDRFSRSLKIKFSDFVNSVEVSREYMQPKKEWTGTSISNPIDGRVQENCATQKGMTGTFISKPIGGRVQLFGA